MIPALLGLLFGGFLAPTVLDPTRQALNARTTRLEEQAAHLARTLHPDRQEPR